MKCKAYHWVKYQNEWHKAGDVFNIDASDAEEMKKHGEVTGDKEPKEPVEKPETETEEPVRRVRKRKTDE